jgi:peroxiredoxin
MTLESKLDALKADFEAGKPPHNVPHLAIEVMHQATAELLASGLVDKTPAFMLPDPNCVEVSLVNLLRKSPLVVSFYRRVWFPYWNMDLQAFEAELPQIIAFGASLVAVSPQTAARSRKSTWQNNQTFSVLNDVNNAVAATFGVRYEIPPYLIDLYKPLRNDLPGFNGEGSWSLPLLGRFEIAIDSHCL